MTVPFNKPPLTYKQQVERLKQRGMTFEDAARAEFYLEKIHYYRLGAYWLPFEVDHTSHTFQAGTTFERVLDHYIFDRELRLLVFDAIERIEVAFRSQWAYEMAHRHSAHAHLDSSLARDQKLYAKNYRRLQKEVSRARHETFIRHLTQKYSEPLPPIWAVCEVMSFGSLSKWYDNLGPSSTRQAIANSFKVPDDTLLASWLRTFNYTRNLCGHHSRLWNRDFTLTLMLPRSQPSGLRAQCNPQSRRIYNTLLFLLYCLDAISPSHSWRNRFGRLISKYNIDVADMGFPSNWQSLAMWQTP